MEKTIYIHIGAHKTATSAIQSFLSKNRKKLRKKGILYPGFKVDHHEFSHEFLKRELSDIEADTRSPVKKIFKEITNSRLNNVIISSEGFCKLWGKIPNLKKMIPEDFQVKIIYYVRRQDDQAEAIYNQIVRDPNHRETLEFRDYIGSGYLAMMDYERVLMPWEEAFGRENIIVRCYEKTQLINNDIFTDFLNAVGLEMDKDFIIPLNKINPSFDWNAIEFIRICNVNSRNDLELHNFLLDYFESNGYTFKEKKYLLSEKERDELLSIYMKSNANVAKKYLGRDDGVLFYDLPSEDDTYFANSKSDIEKIVPIFTKMVYDMEIKHNLYRWNILNQYKKARQFYSDSDLLKMLYDRYFW